MNEARRQRYMRAKPIALAAMELESAAREGYVEAVCAGDRSLHDEVCWMLQAADSTSDSPLHLLLAGDMGDQPGSLVEGGGNSRYRIIRQLGEGGMGVVYQAERLINEGTADEIRQLVALKFINTGSLLTPGVLKRFAEERRILGSLSHPGIANLIDGGSTRDGRPFLALEYVEGERIDQWCDRHDLSLRKRVVLFLKVCAAMRHAHERMVIHRDIKPANILVTASGEPKLLDFGIARLHDQVGGVAAGAHTVTMQRALTLAYASPEQVRGEPLGAGADVWSLGVVLYQLVCGERPFGEGDADSPLDLSNAIVTGRLLPPSRRHRRDRAASPALRRDVPADIDAIVMKALRRDPADRYANVAEFSADLERFLDLRPVRARRGHHWYRVALFLRRHRRGLGMAALLALVLVGFVAERESQLRKLEMARDKTRAIAGFLQDLFENADPTHAGGSQVTVHEVLDRGAAQLVKRSDIAPPVRVSLLLSMARSYNQLSLGQPAVTLLKDAQRLQSTYHATVLERGEVMAALGRGYSTLMDLPSAIVADDQAIALLSQAPGDHAQAILRVRINQLYNHLGVLDVPLDDIDRQIRGLLGQLESSSRGNPELHVQALAVLAMTEGAEGQDEAAIVSATRATTEADKLYVRDDPTQIYYRFVLALVSMRLHPADALQGFRQAIADYDKSISTPGLSLAALLGYFGGALAQMGHTTDAVSALERSARIAAHYADASPDFCLGTLNALARQYLELGRDADAVALLLPHLDELRKRAASRSVWATTNLAGALDTLGTVALDNGQVAQAEQYFRQARDGLDGRGQQVSPESYAASLVGLGEAALARGQINQASIWLAAVQGFNERSHATAQSLSALDAAWLQARVAVAQGNFSQATGLAATAEAIAARRGGVCSRRAQALRKLESIARSHISSTTSQPAVACPVNVTVAAN